MILTGATLVIAAVVGTLLVLQFAASERDRELRQWQVRLGIVADSRLADVEGWLGDRTRFLGHKFVSCGGPE